jgi:hypothetical protein
MIHKLTIPWGADDYSDIFRVEKSIQWAINSYNDSFLYRKRINNREKKEVHSDKRTGFKKANKILKELIIAGNEKNIKEGSSRSL